MELKYKKVGDYYVPELSSGLTPTGKWGRMRYSYLRNHDSLMFNRLFLLGALDQHIQDTQKAAEEMMERLVTQMMQAQGVTEELKARDQMEWIGRMNNIQSAAEEIVRHELIYI